MGIRSIWDNPFYKNYKPLPKWCFSVNFKNFILNKKDTYYAPTLTNAIQNCVWGKRETSVVKTYYAGMEANFPGRVQNTGELNITFNEDENLTVSHVLEELFNGEISNDHFFLGTGNYIYNQEFNKTDRTIILQIYKPAYNMAINDNKVSTLVAEIEFHNCMLVSINEEEFNYSTTDDVLTKTARIAYDFMVWKRKKRFENSGN